MAEPEPAGLSAMDAAQQAVALVRTRLFPFRLERWLALGLVSFLDQCGRSGGGVGYARRGVPGGDSVPEMPGIPSLPEWLGESLGTVLAVAAAILTVVVALVALVLWINSRGVFMYLDDVATGRFDVRRPWHEHREAAASFFAWRFGLAAVTLLGVLALAGCGALGYALVRSGRLASELALALALLGLLPAFLALLLAATLVSVALRDFVAPIQLAEGVGCGTAAGRFWVLLRARPGVFAQYVLLKLVFVIALIFVALVLGCGTCCLGFLPVLAQTLLQPALYFERAWPLGLLRAMGVAVPGDAGPASASGPPPWPPSGPSSPPSSPSGPPPSSGGEGPSAP